MVLAAGHNSPDRIKDSEIRRHPECNERDGARHRPIRRPESSDERKYDKDTTSDERDACPSVGRRKDGQPNDSTNRGDGQQPTTDFVAEQLPGK